MENVNRWLDMLVPRLNAEALLLNQHGWVVSVHLLVQQLVSNDGNRRVHKPNG